MTTSDAAVHIAFACLPPLKPASDLGPSAKLLTQLILNQLVPQNGQMVSDAVNGSFSGTGAPQFSEHNGSMRLRMSLADVRRLSSPTRREEKPRQWAMAGRAAPEREGPPERAPQQHAASPSPAPRDYADTRWNAWVAGDITGLDVNRTGAAFDGRLYAVLGGVDYKIVQQLLVGMAGGWERYDLDTSFNGGTFKGSGYTVGPYLGLKLAPALVLDVWAGWTRVNYDLTSFATGALERGSFDADRYFVSANLTGHFLWGGFRITPRAGVIYANERQKAYTSSLGNLIPAQTIELGKATFGPEIGYRIEMPSLNLSVEPFAFIRGEYDFVRSGATTLGTTVVRPNRWGARAGGGLTASTRGGLSLRLAASYDSIGRANEHVIRGEARLGLAF